MSLRMSFFFFPTTSTNLQDKKKINENQKIGVPTVAQQVKNPTSIHEDVGSIPSLAQ